MLCFACESLFLPGNIEVRESKTLAYSPHFKHHSSGNALKLAAHSGCPLCSRIWSGLSEVQRTHLCDDEKGSAEEPGVSNGNTDQKQPPSVTGQVRQFVTDGCYCFAFRCGVVRWSVYTAPSVKPVHSPDVGPSWAEESTFAGPVMAQAERWLSACLSHHDCSRQSQVHHGVQENWYPTRLIDVGSSEGSVLRLISSADIPVSSPYMTLSHCWGLKSIYRLLTSNVNFLFNHIPWERLTESFRNAISVVRLFHVRYLWIDSLCIIQDSHKDWLHEAALMGNVYKYSHCNIAATGFTDGERGFSAIRDPSVIQPIKIRFSPEAQEEKVAIPRLNRVQRAKWTRTCAEWHEIVELDLWKKFVDQAPLNSRGWVVQERVLSPRILHFTSSQVFWECRELEACETHPLGIPNVMRETRFTKSLSPYTIKPEEYTLKTCFPAPLYHSYGPKTAFHLWDIVLQIYCASSLTRQSDKLVAVSGVARELAPLVQSRYLAGLWEAHLARQLLWIAKPTADIGPGNIVSAESAPAIYRAPSWSWASTDQALKMALQWDYRGTRNHRDFLIDVLDAHVTAAKDNDAFGQVTWAELQLKGRLIPVSLCDISAVTEVNKEKKERYKLVLGGRMLDAVTVFEDQGISRLDEDKVCVPISVSISLPEFSLDRRTLVYGLLLEQLAENRTYRRLGVFMAPDGGDFLTERVVDEAENVRRAEKLDWRDHREWHGEGGKTFGEDVFTLV